MVLHVAFCTNVPHGVLGGVARLQFAYMGDVLVGGGWWVKGCGIAPWGVATDMRRAHHYCAIKFVSQAF